MPDEVKTHNAIIPAQPGYDVVILIDDRFEYYPVVAWFTATDDGPTDLRSWAHPICTENELNGPAKIIRHPDGSIVFVNQIMFAKEQEAEALSYAIKQEDWAEKRLLEKRALMEAGR